MGKKKKDKKKKDKKHGKDGAAVVEQSGGGDDAAPCAPAVGGGFGVAPFVRIGLPVAGGSVFPNFQVSGSSRTVVALNAVIFADSAFTIPVSDPINVAANALFLIGPFTAALGKNLSGSDRWLRIRGLDGGAAEVARDVIPIDIS